MTRRSLLIFIFTSVNIATASFLDSQGPTFVKEPPSRVDFSNTTGTHIECTAQGSPTPSLNWLSGEGKPLASVPGTRQVFNNGSLLFLPFEASSFRQDVHSATYRCMASNAVGRVISRDVRVRAVVLQHYEVEARVVSEGSRSVYRGGTAMLRCLVPSSVRDFVTVTSWVQDSSFNIYPSIKGDGKYHMLPSGELLVRHVDESDKYRSYQCRSVNRLSGVTQLSSGRGVRIVLSDAHAATKPRALDKQIVISSRKDQSAVLPCVTDSSPAPTVSWFRHHDRNSQQLRSIVQDERVLAVADGQCLALLHIQPDDAGKYVCVANNSAGAVRVEITLNVAGTLSASLQPPHATVDMGKRVQFACNHVATHAVSISWFKDGQSMQIGGRANLQAKGQHLVVEHVQREDTGMYQCFVRSEDDSAQGTAELRLGAAHPQLVYKFISQTLQPGPLVSLKCIASGNPTPQLRWTLDGFPLPRAERFLIGQYVTVHGDVISHVNISSVHVEDGGTYQCTAQNRVGEVSHSADLRIYGLPSIREMPNVSAVAGEHLYVKCPVAGYPIESIAWEKGDRKLPLNRRQHVFPNGTLLIENVQREADLGTYTCLAANKQGQTAAKSVVLSVIVPPRITPFTFQTDLHVGDRAGVQCFITKGDLPLEISWQRDGELISSQDAVVVRPLGSYVSALSIDALRPEHAANYTCVATNSAASVHHSSQLLVNVPPRIGPFTFGDLIEGVRTQVQCVIQQGDPPLNLTWLKDDYPVPLEYVKNDDFSSTLVIPLVSLKHSGNYTCVAKNQAKETRQTSTLIVSVPPRWLREPRDQNITRGNLVQLDCQAEGFPTPNVVWRKVIGRQPSTYQDLSVRNRGMQLFANGTLVIRQAFQEHQGEYLCEATNGIGAGISAVVFLTVHVPPEFEIKSAQTSVRRGSAVSLKCEARGDGPMTFSWQMDDRQLNAQTRFEVKNSESNGGFLSELMSASIQKSDSGSYTCVATNPFGRAVRVVHLLVQDAPGRPQDIRLIDSDSRSVRVGWHAPIGDRSPVLQYVVQYHQDTGNAASGWNGAVLQSAVVAGSAMVAVVAGLSPATLYRVRVLAENEQGPGEASEALLVRTDSEPPSGAPQNLHVEPASSSELKLAWLPPPTQSWHGDLLGYYVGYRESSVGRSSGYNFTTVPIAGGGGASTVRIKGLKKFRKYGIVVQAFNEKGPGPMSSEVVSQTLEDVPSAPPLELRCQARSSQSLSVSWQPPLHVFQNGIIQGYKVAYENMEETPRGYIEEETKVTTDFSAELHGLQKYSNYSIQVWAFTKVGDGEKSNPLFCSTDEDVPEAPADIKVVSSSASSFIVSWLPPVHANGVITSYNVYTRVLEAGQERNSLKKRLPATQTHCEFHDLSRKETYGFWVTGLTKVGEGQSTQVVYSTLTARVPAAIISFGRVIATLRKGRVQLECLNVGSSRSAWFGPKNAPVGAERVQADGSLLISEAQKSDEGNYTCSVWNDEGSDQIHYSLRVQVPPAACVLRATPGGTSSLIIHWVPKDNGGTPIRGYILNYRRGSTEWEEKTLPRTITEYTLRNLDCGGDYLLYIVAMNRVGSGAPSQTVTARTEGSVPAAPSFSDLVTVNTSTVTLTLKTWRDKGCPITAFTIAYREKSQQEWITVANMLENKEQFSISGLWPGTHYIIRVTAMNSAGSTSTEYQVTTFPLMRATPSPSLVEESDVEIKPFYTDLSFVITAAAVVLFVFLLISSICLCRKRRGSEESHYDTARRCGDAPVSGKQNLREQYYAAVQKDPALRAPANPRDRIPEYADDIYPYATFHVQNPQQTASPANFKTFLYQDHRLGALETIPLKKSPAHHTDCAQLKQQPQSMRSESEDYDSLGSDSEPEQRSNAPRNARHFRDRESRRQKSSVSAEPSPQQRVMLFAPSNRRQPNARIQDCANRDQEPARSSETSFSSIPVCLDPPTGFSDGNELSEAECDIDSLRRIKLRSQRESRLRNFTITV